MSLKEDIERFKEEFIKPLQDKRDSVPTEKRINNADFKKLGIRTEFLEMFVAKLEKAEYDLSLFSAVAERIAINIEQYRLLEADVLLPQKEVIQKIHNYMSEVRVHNNYEREYNTTAKVEG